MGRGSLGRRCPREQAGLADTSAVVVAPSVWLHGVRRVGKTTLCRSLDGVEYFDCDLLSVRERLRDPESFWSDQRGRRVVLDEIHHAPDPSLVLKTAADQFPETRVIATGSSTLAATAKFSDSLTGRKTDIWLTPMVSEIGTDFSEWVSSYWARDVQELFRIQQRPAFVRFVELVLARSGGMFEATAFAEACEVSRTTIQNYLEVLQVTGVASVVRPYSSRRTTEIVSAPNPPGCPLLPLDYQRMLHHTRCILHLDGCS